MRLFGAMEYLIVTVGGDGTLHGLRMRHHRKRMTVTRVLEVPPDERSAADRFAGLCREMEWRRDVILAVGMAFPGAAFFRCRMPEMSPRELSSALQFEVPRQVLKLPPEWGVQFIAGPADGEGQLAVSVLVTPREELNRFFDMLAEVHIQIDECISPFLALPPLPPGSRVFLPLFEPDFYWADQSFHPVSDRLPCNEELRELLKKEFSFTDGFQEKNFDRFLPELMIARLVASADFKYRNAGLKILPNRLRPRRLRSQLRLAVILLLLLAGMWCWNAGGRILAFHSEYSAITSRTASYKSRTAEIQRLLRRRDNKELKEMNRVLEQNFGDREIPVMLAHIAEVIPSDVLVSNFRMTDTGVDLTLHTTRENLNIGAALRKISGFKVSTLQSRRMNDTLSMITVKLNRTGGGK